MRFMPASLVLCIALAGPAAAYASPLLDPIGVDRGVTRITYDPMRSGGQSRSVPLGDVSTGDSLMDVRSQTGKAAVDGHTILPPAVEHTMISETHLEPPSAQYFGGDRTNILKNSAGILDVRTIPEPPPLVLLGTGLLFAAGALWRFGRTKA